MILTRVIPCLLIHNGGLVKTVKFTNPNYIGDPVNAVKLFNEKQANELLVLDIDATVNKQEPNYRLIEEIASEAFMPVCYGGGIKNVEQMKQIFKIGIEKISVSSLLFEDPDEVRVAVDSFGSSSIAVTLDVKKNLFGQYNVFIHNAQKSTGHRLDTAIDLAEKANIGEIVVNSIDNDGMMKGYDINLIKSVSKKVPVPVVALGGAGSLQDIKEGVFIGGASAVAAGSLFVYHGPRKAVLINYPTEDKIEELFTL